MSNLVDPDELSDWDRSKQLFLIRGITQLPTAGRPRYLLPLVTDTDPVVRGKACSALEPCSTDARLEAVDRMIERDSAETTILALELLTTLRDHDFSDRLRPLLRHPDVRVVKTCLDAATSLPVSRAIRIHRAVLDNYDPEVATSLAKSIRTINHPCCLSILKSWFSIDGESQRDTILRIAAGLPGNKSSDWVKKQLNDQRLDRGTSDIIKTLMSLSD